MKRIIAFVALLVTCSFIGTANAQFVTEGAVSLEGITNAFNADSLVAGQSHVMTFRVNNTATCRFNIGNGFRVFSPDGANYGPLSGDTLGDVDGNSGNGRRAFLGGSRFGLIVGFNRFSNDGLGADTITFFGVVNSASNIGLAPGFNEVAYSVGFASRIEDTGKRICVDSSFSFPNSRWLWAQVCNPAVPGYASRTPTWSGQKCWTIYNVPNQPPAITCSPAPITNSHCSTFTRTFVATDPDTTGGTISYQLVSGPGSINSATGAWSWATADETNVGQSIEIIVTASNAGGTSVSAPCTTDVVVTNEAPVLTAGCGTAPAVSTGSSTNVAFASTDDCGNRTYSIVDTAAGVTGTFGINAVTGVMSYTPSAGDAGISPVCFDVAVTDAVGAADTCTVCFPVVVGSKYKVQIEKVSDAIQNQFHGVDITLQGIDASKGLGGFDLLISYDNSAMSLNSATPGNIYDSCNWEYFTFRFGASGNCSGGCPSGLVRIIGIAETNNGAAHPIENCAAAGMTLATLNFLLSNDRTLECQYAPIRFYWIECGDNAFSDADGSDLIIANQVFEFHGDTGVYDAPFLPANALPPATSFPTYLGVPPTFCLNSIPGKPDPIRDLDLQNGGIDIVCADSIDDRGDLNLDGQGYTIADVVMYTQYFIEGLAAFPQAGLGVEAAIAASDANADGIPLSVADLVYMIRVLVGDAQPYDKASSELTSASYTVNDGIVSVNAEMGGALVVLAGDVTPTVLASNMNATVAFDGTNTRVLLTSPYSVLSGVTESFEGSFLNIGNAEVVSVELASTAGTVVATKAVPTAYSLDQNYPNPFNPKTTIRFGLPNAGAYTLTFYNVTGQVVNEVSGTSEAGNIEYSWDASNLASGVYFYKVVANNGAFSKTMKAVLIK